MERIETAIDQLACLEQLLSSLGDDGVMLTSDQAAGLASMLRNVISDLERKEPPA